MAYKLSNRKNVKKRNYSKRNLRGSNLGYGSNIKNPKLNKISKTLFLFGILSLFTSFIFSINIDEPVVRERLTAEKKIDTNNKPSIINELQGFPPAVTTPEIKEILYPLVVKQKNVTYEVEFKALDMRANNWTVASGELLNSNKEYLFSFTKEMWYETGRDSDGPWSEKEDSYSMKVTIPKPGKYYLSFDIEAGYKLPQVEVKITRQLGSTIPHFWFGLFLVIIGLILNYNSHKRRS